MIVSIRFQPIGKLYDFQAGDEQDVRVGDFVLVETSRGQQLGEIAGSRAPQNEEDIRALKPIKRRATGCDLAMRQHWEKKESEALEIVHGIVGELGMVAKIVRAEYTFDGRRLTFFYVSDEKKLNFDKFLRRLKQNFSVLAELRRIGPRDHAKVLEGYGACGQLCCCSRFLTYFAPVSIKMAKVQGISLNPEEITGVCGRLRCCLGYEHEQYTEAMKGLPRRKKRVRTPHGEGVVVDLLPLQNVVVVQVQDRRLELPAEEVELIS
ncbi:MAG: stage 0 sporulation protein [Anaerolineae bacterium]|nr:stage 0 sporulation protein [Anaerolineae bacterium]